MSEEQFEEDLEAFRRSSKLIDSHIPWLYSHYTDPRNRDNSGRIQTRADLNLVDMHIKEMQRIIDKWKRDFP